MWLREMWCSRRVELELGRLQAVLRCVDFSIVRCLVLAGPGFTKEQLHRYMLDQAVKRDLKELASNKSRIIEAHASSAFKHSLKDVLSSPTVMTQIKDTKAAAEGLPILEPVLELAFLDGEAEFGRLIDAAVGDRIAGIAGVAAEGRLR